MKNEYEYKTYADVWNAARSWRYWLNGRKGVYILLEAITRIAYDEGHKQGSERHELGPNNSNTVT